MNNLINMNNFVIKDIKRKNPNHKKRHLKKKKSEQDRKDKIRSLLHPVYKINTSYIRV